MRRPTVDPWTRDQLVSQRNMMQGMAAARVPAAYPVPRIRLPRMLGGLKGSPPATVPPEAVTIHRNLLTGGTGELPAFPEGMTSAVMIVGYRGRKDLVIPDGWTYLDGGVGWGDNFLFGGRIGEWAVLCINAATGTEDTTITFSTLIAGEESTYDFGAYALGYFTGGAGGSWSVIPGTDTASSNDAYVTGVPGGAEAWIQFGICTSVYTVNDTGGTDFSNGFCQAYVFPVGGTHAVMPSAPLADGTWVDFNGLGAYGMPNTVSRAAVWG